MSIGTNPGMSSHGMQGIQEVGAALMGVLIWLLGDLNTQLQYLAGVMAIDSILGGWVAKKKSVFQTRKFVRKSVEKLFIYGIIIFLFNAADVVVNTSATLRWCAIVALLARDIFSSLNHIDYLGYKNLASPLIQMFRGQLGLKGSDGPSNRGEER